MENHPYLENRIIAAVVPPGGAKWNTFLANPREKATAPFIFPDTKKSYDCPFGEGGLTRILDNSVKNVCPDILDTDSKPKELTQQGYFAEIFGVDLNPYLPTERNFWKTHAERRVVVTNGRLQLNLNNPKSMLKYLILLANPTKIAKSELEYNTRKLASYELMITEHKESVNNASEAIDLDMDSMAVMSELLKTEKSAIDYLRVCGIKPSPKSTLSELKIALNKRRTTDMGLFISIYKDSKFKQKVFVNNAIAIGEVVQKGNRYELATGVVLGDINDTVSWFSNPENQEARIRISERIKATT